MRDEPLTNLLEETIEFIATCHKSVDDVRWVGLKDGSEALSFEAFKELASKCEVVSAYDSGFGSAVIRMDLVVVGDDWWLERYEYDGSEYWEFKQLPVICNDGRPISRLYDK